MSALRVRGGPKPLFPFYESIRHPFCVGGDRVDRFREPKLCAIPRIIRIRALCEAVPNEGRLA
jgi:hypothetical protein